MKQKLFYIVILVYSLLIIPDTIYAQGIYSKGDGTADENSEGHTGSLRDFPSGPPTQPGKSDDPIGEGILILSVLAGGYTLVKKRKMSKK